jgi:uncharacterized protein (UPF0332 family)
MSFDWSAFLHLASDLAAGGTEAKRRSSISRAYYSAFCSARDWLFEHDSRFSMPRSGDTHRAVWDHFNLGPEKEKRQVAHTGLQLRDSRVAADYNKDSPLFNDARPTETALARAQTILKLLGALASRGSGI